MRGRTPIRRSRCDGPPVEGPDQVGGCQGPYEADRDHRRAHQQRVPDHLSGGLPAQSLDDDRQLQSDQDEEGGVEEEAEDRPHREALHAALGRGYLGRAETEVEPGGDHGEHPGEAELVGRDERTIGAEQRDRELRVDVVDPLADLSDHPPDGEADRDAARDVDEELDCGPAGRDALADRRRHRDLVGDEGARVVDEALALDDVDQAARSADPPHDCGRGDRVGRRDDRAERERDGPWQADHVVRDHRDHTGGHEDEPDRGHRDCAGVGPEAAEVGEERRGVQQWRQEDEQDEVGLELDVGNARDEAEDEAAEHERDRVRNVEPVGEGVQSGRGDEQRRDHDLEVVHASILSGARARGTLAAWSSRSRSSGFA